MKTIFTLILCVTASILPGQTFRPDLSKILPFSKDIKQQAVPLKKKNPDNVPARQLPNVLRNNNPVVNPLSDIIGTTTYDLQTNKSGCNRLYNVNNTVGAVWTMSQSLSSTFSDRGTGENFYNGTAWNPVPSTNLDSISWSNIDMSNNTEYLVGHFRSFMPYDLALLKRTPAGSGTWAKTYLPAHPAGHFCIWSRMRVGGASGNSIHVIALTSPTGNGGTLLNGIDGALTYSRSQDGGITWNQVHVALPMMDSSHYASIEADSYAIDVKGNTVVISQGSMYNDWVIWKSTDDGTTWTRTVIWPFPIPAYDINTMITDIDGDLIGDTIEFIDGSQAVLIDNNNVVHCWVGRMRVLADIPGGFGYFPTVDGLYYWKESSSGTSPMIVASTYDLDNDSTINIEPDIPLYECSLTSMPSAAVDAANNIYVTYSSIKENTSSGNVPAQSYRNVYCKASPDNGVHWTAPVNMFDTDFDECVYPSLARNANPLHLIYQQDGEPGTSFSDPDPIANNDILHISEQPNILFSGVPLYPLGFNKIQGTVYLDLNVNGIRDTSESGIMSFPVHLSTGNIVSTTNASGNYAFMVDTGSHVVSLQTGPNWQITSDSSTYTVYIDSLSVDSLDFGIYPVNAFYQLNSSLTPGIPRCNNTINYTVNYQNTGTLTTFGSVFFIKDSQLPLVQTNPPYDSISGDTIFWSFNNLLPYEQRLVAVNLSSLGLTIGDTIVNCHEIHFANGASGGISSACSTQAIVCAWDPNDKTVIPEGTDAPHYTLLSDTLIYTIRFQNTGTDTAFAVRIRDTLDAFLDPASFQFIGSSHPAQITRQPDGTILFAFDNILLPDSGTNLQGSNGFVKYSVLPLPSTPVGTAVYNTAHIFFDFNSAIVTNTTFNTLVDVIGVAENNEVNLNMMIYPNPFSGETKVTFSNPHNSTCRFIVTDISGRQIKISDMFTGNSFNISSVGWTPGMYFCRIQDQTGKIIGVEKLVVR